MTLLIVAILALGLFGPPANVSAAPPPAPTGKVTAEAAPNRLLVAFQPGTSDARAEAVIAGQGARTIRQLDSIGVKVVELPAGRSRAVAEASFASEPNVRYVEPDYQVSATAQPNDPYFANQWALQNTGQTGGTPGADIKAPLAWNITTGSRAVVVGVVDTGVDYNHPDLAANIWTAPAGWSLNGCGAGTHGYAATSGNGSGSCNPMDDNNHGTHVAGTIGAVGNNGVGVTGINWNVSIMALKFLDSSGQGYTSDAVTVIDYAVKARQRGVNIRVLNNSWGGSNYSQALSDEINVANTNGILFVAAAGNNGSNNDVTPTYPASYSAPNLIAVAATDDRDALASFSNYGASSVHLGAPGVNILSTICAPDATTGACAHGYDWFSGTSMATPHVSGAAALLLSAPGLTGLDVPTLKNCLLAYGDSDPALAGTTITGKRLNVYASIVGCQTNTAPPAPAPAPAPQPVSWSPWNSLGGILTDAPAAAGFNGRVYVFAKGSDNALYVKSSPDGVGWTGWANLGGILTAAPAAASVNGQLYVFAKGSDNALYVKSSSDGVNFTDWTRLGGILTAPPAAAGVNGTLYVFAKGSDNALYLKRSADGVNWSGWQNLGGILTAAPAAAGFQNQVYVFAKGSDNALYEKHSPDGVNFTGWANYGGVLTAAPAAASFVPPTGGEMLYTFAKGTDNTLYERHTSDGASWTDWRSLGGQLVGPPAAAGAGSRLYAFAWWRDNTLYERHTQP